MSEKKGQTETLRYDFGILLLIPKFNYKMENGIG